MRALRLADQMEQLRHLLTLGNSDVSPDPCDEFKTERVHELPLKEMDDLRRILGVRREP